MGPYSIDLRERVVAAVDNREGSLREIARKFRVSLTFISRLLRRRRETGTLKPKPHGGCPPPVLKAEDLQRLSELIREDHDATLEQLRQRGGFQCSLTTIWRAIRRQNLTHKKKSMHASERDRPEVQKKRRAFCRKVKRIDLGRLVFVDETGVTTAMTPKYAWAPRGERAYDSAPFYRKSVTVVAAIGLDGVRAPLVFSGSTDAVTFESYIEKVLVPELHKKDVVVFDNLTAHLGAAVPKAIESVGARVLRLPPYSPDYNPIESMFSKVKGFLRQAAARVKDDLYDAIGDALRAVTNQDIIGWYQEAGLYAMRG